MTRRTRLTVELLESRSLLSGLSVSLSTDKAVYQVGQPIQMTFTETNVSSRPVTVDEGPSTDGFTVRQNSVTVWQSNAGINPLYIEADTLQPGQSLTLTATWNGIPTGGSTAGSGPFVVSNQLAPQGVIATFQIVAASSQPSPVSSPDPQPSPPAQTPTPSSVAVTLTTDHEAYKPGHRVRITLTLTNVGNSAVNLPTDPSVNGFTVWQGSTVVWRSTRSAPGMVAQTLEPGQSIHRTAVWNGRPNQPGIKKRSPGTYTVQADDGGSTGFDTISIGGSHTPARSKGAEVALDLGHGHGKEISHRGG